MNTTTLQRRSILKTMSLGAAALALPPALIQGSLARPIAHGMGLPRSAPEDQGVSSDGLLKFLEAWEGSRARLQSEPHSFMLVRHGHVVAETWWAPYAADATHTLNSLTKVWISTAVGLAVTEGLFKLDDPFVSIFPDEAPANPSAYLQAMTVHDLLIGSTGHMVEDISAFGWDLDSEQVLSKFMNSTVTFPPGTHFVYNPPASLLLMSVIQKQCGQPVQDYLQSRLFDPLGIRDLAWTKDKAPWIEGCHTEDLAKLGLMYLNQGKWRGKQLLPASWVKEATSSQISTAQGGSLGKDWQLGYGYQFWPCRNNAYRGDGAFGQYCIVMPEQDAVAVITSNTSNTHLQGVLDLVWDHVLPAMDTAVPRGPATARMQEQLRASKLRVPAGKTSSPLARKMAHRTFELESNSLGATAVAFDFNARSCEFALTDSKGTHRVRCGLGKWLSGSTSMPQTPPRPLWGKYFPPLDKVAGAAAWTLPGVLEMHWRFYETPDYYAVTCRFEGDMVELEFESSLADSLALTRLPPLKGRAVA